MEFDLDELKWRDRFTNARDRNPLLIDLVLRKILAYVPDEDLWSCQLVCNLWRKGVDHERECRVTVRVQDEVEVNHSLRRHISHPHLRICHLHIRELNLDLPNVQGLISLALPSLTLLTLNEVKIQSHSSLDTLLRRVCPLLSHLDMGTIKTVDGNYLKYFPISSESTSRPLTFPKLTHFEYISYNDVRSEATLLSDVAAAFPNLRSLIVANLSEEEPSSVVEARLCHLKSLKLRMTPIGGRRLRSSHVRFLLEMGLELEELIIWNVARDLDSDLFRKWIHSQGPTLKELTLQQYTMEGLFTKCRLSAPSPFPNELPALVKLKIGRPLIKNFNQVLAAGPNLVKLDLDFYDGADWGGILPSKLSTASANQIYSLRLESIDPKSLTKLGPLFQKRLKSLEIGSISEGLLAAIFKSFTQLEHLVIHDKSENGGTLTQKGWTGLEPDFVRTLWDGSAGDVSIKALEDLRDPLFIGNLTELKTLALMLKTGDGDVIKDLVAYGLPHCPSFRLLVLACGNNAEIATPSFRTFMKEEGFLIVEENEESIIFLSGPSDPCYSTEEEDEENISE